MTAGIVIHHAVARPDGSAAACWQPASPEFPQVLSVFTLLTVTF